MKKGELSRLILGIAAATIIVVGVAAIPGMALALKPFIGKKSSRVRNDSLERSLRSLRERRLIEIVNRNGGISLAVTERGKRYLKQFELSELGLAIPKRWDGQWSVILFDIPESYKRARDALRMKLKEMGCLQFHKSVFVHPAPCEDEIDFLTELLDIRRFVTVFRTSSLGHQEHRAYRHFSLTPRKNTRGV